MAFAGTGPYYPQQPNDAVNSDAVYVPTVNPDSYMPPGGQGTVFSVGIESDTTSTYQYGTDFFQNQGRTYAIGVDVSQTSGGTAPGAASAANSTISPATASITANGTSTQIITVTASDVNNNPLTSGGATVVFVLVGGGTLSSPTVDNGNGTYTTTLTSPTIAGNATVTATLGGIPVGTAVSASSSVVTFTPASGPGSPVYFGNPLVNAPGGADGLPPLVILGEYSAAGPLPSSSLALPNGTITDVQFYGDNYILIFYVLQPLGSGAYPNEQTFQVVASQSFQGSLSTGVQDLSGLSIPVSDGDLLAFAGVGPYYAGNNDALNSDATYEDASNPGSYSATPPGGAGTQFTVGLNGDSTANYEYLPEYLHASGPDLFHWRGGFRDLGRNTSRPPGPFCDLGN